MQEVTMSSALMRLPAFPDLAGFHSRFDELLEQLGSANGSEWAPRLDVTERDDAILIRADLPGIKPEEIDVEVSDDVLTISGKHEEETEEKEGERVIRRERRYGSFRRSMALPKSVKPEEIAAESSDGVLELTIPKPAAEQSDVVHIKPKSKATS
jgi:HSP20 family protein